MYYKESEYIIHDITLHDVLINWLLHDILYIKVVTLYTCCNTNYHNRILIKLSLRVCNNYIQAIPIYLLCINYISFNNV